MNLNKISLNLSSLPFNLNYSKYSKKKKIKNKKFLREIQNLIKFKVGGFEFPYIRFFDLEEKNLKDFEKFLIKNNLTYILDCNKKFSTSEFKKILPIAKRLNLKFIRIKATNVLSNEKYKLKKTWKYILNEIIIKIKRIAPILKKNNLKLAIENHQDLSSSDLNYIIKKIGCEYVGINFDVGNSICSFETVEYFIKKNRKHILNIHLKNYQVFYLEKIISLKSVALDDGYIDFKKVLILIKKYTPNANLSLEMGALDNRNILIENESQKKFVLNKIKLSKPINIFYDFDKIDIAKHEIKLITKSLNFLKKLKL